MVVVAGKRNYIDAVQQGAHIVGALVSKRG